MKRGQTEIIGLVVIVILLVFIAIIYIRLVNIKKDQQPIRANVKVTNLLNSIMRYSCNNGQIKDLINNDVNTCDGNELRELRAVIEAIITQAIDNNMYKLTISKGSNTYMQIIGPNFDNCKQKFVDTYIKPRFTAVLELCENS